jgi:hypothetical protein
MAGRRDRIIPMIRRLSPSPDESITDSIIIESFANLRDGDRKASADQSLGS